MTDMQESFFYHDGTSQPADSDNMTKNSSVCPSESSSVLPAVLCRHEVMLRAFTAHAPSNPRCLFHWLQTVKVKKNNSDSQCDTGNKQSATHESTLTSCLHRDASLKRARSFQSPRSVGASLLKKVLLDFIFFVEGQKSLNAVIM